MDDEQKLAQKQRRELTRKRNSRNVAISVAGIFCLMFLFPVLPYVGGIVGFHMEISEGDRVGQVVKLSNKGFVWRTWEGTMGVTQSGAYVDAWDFSIDPKNPRKEELLSKLRQAYTTGNLIRIHYSQKLLPLYRRGKTSYFAEDIEVARPSR